MVLPKQKKSYQYQFTVKDYIKVFAAYACLGGLIFFCVRAASTPKEPTTYTQVWDTLVAHGYSPIDRTDFYQEVNHNMGITKNITCKEDTLWFEFFTFADSQCASSAYGNLTTQMNAIEREYQTESADTGEVRANFEVRSLTAGGKYYYLMRISDTLLYAYCEEERANEIRSVTSELGYVMD